IDRKLQTSSGNDVAATRSGRQLVIVGDERVVTCDVDAVDLPADLDRLFPNKRFAREFERLFFRIRILCGRSHPAEGDFEVRRQHLLRFGGFLNFQLVQEHLIEENLPNLSIDLPDLFVEWRHDAFVLVKNVVGNGRQFLLQLPAIQLVQRFATMTLKEPAQNIVQQFSRIDRLQIERCFTAWLEPQHSLRKKPVCTVAVNAEAAGAVNKVRTEFEFEQVQKIGIRDLSIVTAEVWSGA